MGGKPGIVMRLELTQKLQQQQVLIPQMILSMDILLLPTLDLEQRIQQEFSDNPALELVEQEARDKPIANSETAERGEAEPTLHERLRDSGSWSFDERRPRKSSNRSSDAKHAALQNTPDKPPGLKETLMEQLRLQTIPGRIRDIGEDIISGLDNRGYLGCEAEELGDWIEGRPSTEEIEQALETVRGLEPAGVGATDLRDCLLLQLQRDGGDRRLEEAIIRNHLLDLGLNKLPKLARELGYPVEEIKEAAKLISSLDPMPGRQIESEETVYIRPDVLVEEIDGELEISMLDYSLPQLEISRSCRTALKDASSDRKTSAFLRKKIESAKWLIHAIEQRQRTIKDIALAIVEYQQDFMLEGPKRLKALKMQTIADTVGVHLSTISRAIKGKYIETPSGIYELRYFFTGGVDNAEGEIESRRNVHRRIQELIEKENREKPYSDTAIAHLLQEEGLKIARRTVTKYREHVGIPASRLRRSY